ncbi:ARHG1 factor, partial [Calonectris borealis]|nr:ARHG1 factor [Calonectris borealis]
PQSPAAGARGAGGSVVAIIGAEDEDFENDIEPNPDDQNSLFQSLELVRQHPAYLMAFLQHVVLQFDSCPVLCYLHVDMLRRMNPKEGKKQFLEFCHMFLDKAGVSGPGRGAPAADAPSPPDRTRPELLSDEVQRRYLQEIQAFQEPEISRQLEDFRSKRLMGMTPGEQELTELESYRTRDHGIREAKEKQLAEVLLARLEEMHLSHPRPPPSSAIFGAIVTYMKYLGVKTKLGDGKKSKSNFFRKKKTDQVGDPRPPLACLGGATVPGDGHLEPPADSAKYRGPPSPTARPKRRRGGAPRPPPSPQAPRADAWLRAPRIGRMAPPGDLTPSLSPPTAICARPLPPHAPPGRRSPRALCAACPRPPVRLSRWGRVSACPRPPPWLPARRGAPPPRPPRPAAPRRLPGKLGRSESLRTYERKRSQRGSAKGKQPRSRSDVDLQAAARATRPEEGPAPPPGRRRPTLEPGGPGGGEPPPSFLPTQSEETEPRVAELELEPPPWRQLAAPDALLRLKKSEVKRQEVINELFLTEHAHVRMLRVLLEVFYQPMLREAFFDEHELSNIFPSLEDLVEVHSESGGRGCGGGAGRGGPGGSEPRPAPALFLDSLKKLREESGYVISEIGDVLLARFEGTEGSWFQKISARFCSRQSFALEQLKAKQRKDTRFSQFIQEAESQPRCRRLQLKDIIPTEMQRLTKYPLLLHNITKCTEAAGERAKVEQAAECCRQILNHVNQEVRDMENLMKLKDYQRRLDLSNLKQSMDPLLSEFKNSDITKRNLVHEGPLTWRVTRDKAVDVHVLLLDDLLVLLQRQEERLVLRCHSRTITPTPDGKQMLSPIIKLSSAMTREVATDHKAFYVIISWENGAQIYELVAQTVSERK